MHSFSSLRRNGLRTSYWGHRSHRSFVPHTNASIHDLVIVFIGLTTILIVAWVTIRQPWKLWDLTKDASNAQIKEATAAAQKSSHPILPRLTFSEGQAPWVLLYNHARVGQIDPKHMRKMRRKDLDFLAGMDFPHPDLVAPRQAGEQTASEEARHREATKLMANVSRAKTELNTRNLVAMTVISAYAIVLGTIIGALITSH